MPEYPYRCEECNTSWEVSCSISDYKKVASCPKCKLETTSQDYSAKGVSGFVNRDGNWTGGKQIYQLHPNHPDRMVTSKRQMERVYRENGLSIDTGHFTSNAAQIKATVPKAKRLGVDPSTIACGAVIEEN